MSEREGPMAVLIRTEKLLAEGKDILLRLQALIDQTRDPIARAALVKRRDAFVMQTAAMVAHTLRLRGLLERTAPPSSEARH